MTGLNEEACSQLFGQFVLLKQWLFILYPSGLYHYKLWQVKRFPAALNSYLLHASVQVFLKQRRWLCINRTLEACSVTLKADYTAHQLK